MNHPAAAPRHVGGARWQVRLLGAVELRAGSQTVITRFPSRAVAALLARLALAPQRAHAREELIELLWPGVAPDVGRNRLRQALSTLKALLEPARDPGAAVLRADRLALRVADGALHCDVHDFEAALGAGDAAAARAAYGGELMPGFYDEWIHAERRRLHMLFEALPAASPGAAHRVEPGAPPVVRAPAADPPLPRYLTRLFGAEAAAARVRALVEQHRLVTLLGPGGSGKTRLAVEVAQQLHAAFDRTAFVPLVACTQRAQVLDTLVRVLLLPAAADDTAAIVAALAGRQVLLVLDNAEQLVDVAAPLLSELLARLPRLHLLVTSRRALGIDGEFAIVAEPLPLPPADAAPADAAVHPALALFVDRARAVRADFHLGARNHGAVVELVRLLHGMPLAIELAASRVRSFAPADMVRLLAQGGGALALLARSGPRAGLDPRHASMAEVIAWSWRLLDADAQRLMAALTLFPADAGVAAAAAAAGDAEAATALRLDELVGHSLLRHVTAADDSARFVMDAPVREFVAAQMSPDATARQRLSTWALQWARTLGPAAMPAQVAIELPLVHALLSEPGRDALTLALALRGHWDTDGMPGPVQAALAAALEQLPHDASDERSAGHELLAYLRFEAGDAADALAHAEAALTAARGPAARARALVRRAWVSLASGRGHVGADVAPAQVRAWLAEAAALAQSSGDHEALARALHQQAVLASHAFGDHAAAERLLEQSQALWLALGDTRKANARLRNRAQCWLRLGRADDALAAYELCERRARDEGDWVGRIDSLLSLATLQARRRQWAAALASNREAVHLSWQRWHRHGLAYALWNPPRLLARLRRPRAAIRLAGFAAHYWQRAFGPLGDDDRAELRRVRRLVAVQIGAVPAEALWIEGAALDVGAAVSLALHDDPADG